MPMDDVQRYGLLVHTLRCPGRAIAPAVEIRRLLSRSAGYEWSAQWTDPYNRCSAIKFFTHMPY